MTKQINIHMYGYESNHKPFTWAPAILHLCGSFDLQYFTKYYNESPLESRKVTF